MTLNGRKIRLSGATKKNQKLIRTDRIRRSLDESTLGRHRNYKYYQAMT